MKHFRIFALLMIICLLITGCHVSDVAEPPKEEQPIQQIPEPPVEKRVSFFGVGDNLIHNCVYWQADNNAPDSEYDFLPMYELMRTDIESADIAYINQETVLGGTEIGVSSYPMFNSPQELGRDMLDLGFDVFSLATNHAFDKGERGVANTYAFFQAHPEATCIGMYKKGEETIKVVEKEDVKIAFINYTFHKAPAFLKVLHGYFISYL